MIMIGALLLMLTCPQPTDANAPESVSTELVSEDISPLDFARGLRDFYRASTLHDRCEFVVVEDGGDRIRTEAKIRSVRTPEGSRAIAEFGPFTVLMESNRIAMVHRHNRKSVLTAEGSSLMELISGVMPPLPIPQLPLMLQSGREDSATLDELEPLGPWFQSIRIVHVQRNEQGFLAECESRAGNRASIRTDRNFRIVQFRSEINHETARGVFEMTASELDPSDIESWDRFVSDRDVVDDVISLNALASAIKVGDRLSELGLVDDSLQPWSFDTAIERAVAAAPASRQFIALVLYDTFSDSALAHAGVALDSLQEVSRQLRRAAALGAGPMIRLTPIMVGNIGRRTLSSDDIKLERDRWPQRADTELLEVDSSLVWATPFNDPILRFHPDSRCVVVIVDGQRRIEAILPGHSDRELLLERLNQVVK